MFLLTFPEGAIIDFAPYLANLLLDVEEHAGAAGALAHQLAVAASGHAPVVHAASATGLRKQSNKEQYPNCM